MHSTFGRTAAALSADRSKAAAVSLAVAVAVLAAWAAWLIFARVPLYEVSASARLEAERAPHPLQAPIDGLLVESFLEPGRRVKADDVLVRIEAETQKATRREAETRLTALEREARARSAELALLENAAADERAAAQAALAAARARLRESEAPADYLRGEAGRLTQLSDEGVIAPRDAMRGVSEAERQAAAAANARAAVEQLGRDESVKERERSAQRQRLLADLERLDGEARAVRESLGRLDIEVDRRLVRAPIDGIVAEAAELRPGAFVAAGQTLGVVVPDGRLVLIARLPPTALGRVAAGQPARLRLTGFPAAQYGTLAAHVARVSGEVREGTIRVELSLDAPERSRVPLRHGLPAEVEIEVERLSPAALLLRLAGQALDAPRAGRSGISGSGP
ncbi:MAG TPA: HlyD family efflux transporter periplasmic adaptor subunit [Thermoanaerobaculia bacterium]|jgi:membrane fusion protein (multidrug efflux system)|nr:HlyD family efflux transporter periplasmic adaptor subunit [Thermoanaerobaculia bacterium]